MRKMKAFAISTVFVVLLIAILVLSGSKTDVGENSRGLDATPQYLNDKLLELVGESSSRAPVRLTPVSQFSDSLGIPADISYSGRLALRSDNPGFAYCSGLIFLTYCRAMEDKNITQPDYLGIAREEFFNFRREFYGVNGNRKTFVDAIVQRGLGEEISDVQDLRPGDMIQFWRNNGSGHSVICLGGTFASDGSLKTLEYWSKQSQGYGRNEENAGDGSGQINDNEIYIVRCFTKKR